MVNLEVEILGMKFKNPVLPAAGPIVKDGKSMLKCAQGGAGGLVAKTISIEPAKVPKPNMCFVKHPGKTVNNRYFGMLNTELWSEKSYEQWLAKEYEVARSANLPLIASIGYTASELKILGPLVEKKVDAIEFSIHYLGKDLGPLIDTAQSLKKAVSLPIIIKVSPSISDVEEFVKAIDPYVDGYAAVNSLGPGLHFNVKTLEPCLGSKFGYGWLSGPWFKPIALRFVFEIARNTSKPVFGVGGIATGEDVAQFILAGASAVQVCTCIILEGYQAFSRIVNELKTFMEENGYETIEDMRGKFIEKIAEGQEVKFENVKSSVIEEKCIGCGLCAKSCVYEAIEIINKKAKISSKCEGCGVCASVCPQGAIKLKR